MSWFIEAGTQTKWNSLEQREQETHCLELLQAFLTI